MIYTAYTLYDVKAAQYNPPFFQPNDALAKRLVHDLAVDNNTTVGRHPSDFKLYKVALYNDTTGIFDSTPIMEHVCDVNSLLPAPIADLFAPQPPAHRSNGGV